MPEKLEGGEVKHSQGRKICQAGSKWPQDTQETDCAGGRGNREGYKEASPIGNRDLKGFKERKSIQIDFEKLFCCKWRKN